MVSGIPDSAPLTLLAVREMVRGKTDTAGALATFRGWLEDGISGTNPNVVLGAAHTMASAGEVDEALTLLEPVRELEPMAYMVQLYLGLHQPRYAAEKVKAMAALEEDHTLTQLAGAWVGLAGGGSAKAVEDAYHTFQDFIDKYAPSAKLLNGVATACMLQGNFDEAFAILSTALEVNANDPETLANLVVVGNHAGKSQDVIDRWLLQLRGVAPSHTLLSNIDSLESKFAAAAANYS